MTDAEQLAAFQAENPDIEIIEMVWPDMNGVMRGKWLPAAEAGKLVKGDARIPASTYALDIFSEDTGGSGMAAERGDPDAKTIPLMHTLRRVTWTKRPTAQIMLRASGFDGEFPSPFSPRDALAAVADRYAGKGLTPVVAPELEFYLLDPTFDETGRAQPPIGPGGMRLSGGQVFLLDMQRHFAPVIEAIEEAAAALGAPTSGVLVEFGPGQFETNLNHQADPLLAADQAVLLRRAIRGAAQAHGYEACFMAKPFGMEVGSGQHFHASVLDENGANIFSGDDPKALNDALAGAIGGCLRYMPESTLGFAPHLNSYRRLRPNGFAPSAAAWGFDNRSVAVRSPGSTGKAARLEHRVAGADANPYIAMALILSAMLDGIEAGENPGPALEGNAGPSDGEALPASWSEAVTAFGKSDFVKRALGEEFTHAYCAMKTQEMSSFAERVSDVEHQVTLRML